MVIKKFEFNPFPVNTYILWDEVSKEAIIIDAGCYFEEERTELINYIRDNKLTIKHLLATHLHLDHNFGNPFVSKTFNIKLEANKGDEFLLQNMEAQARAFNMPLPDAPIPIGKYINENDEISFGTNTLRAIHVPGHSPGSIVYYCEQEKVAFAGDVLFRSSIGRTDLAGGDFNTLIIGIKNKLFTLPDDTIVYPGHGPFTSIGFEKQHNPFI
ncbi:MAG: MBL fold metallo-hydrolase [Bacteroidaceae bacterium]|nr:MBL fold metallo-hydrolase [Bacteroidaceae bacterium]